MSLYNYCSYITFPIAYHPSITQGNGGDLFFSLAVGDTLSVSVNIYRTPLFNITWLHDDRVLVNGEQRVSIDIDMFNSTFASSMLLRSSLILNDSGLYEVKASNVYGSTSMIFNVSVNSKI